MTRESGAARCGFRELKRRPEVDVVPELNERRAPTIYRGWYTGGRAIRENRAVPRRPRLSGTKPDTQIVQLSRFVFRSQAKNGWGASVTPGRNSSVDVVGGYVEGGDEEERHTRREGETPAQCQ